jgi:hypothetical protein
MTKPSPVAYAALGVALLSLFSPLAGVAEAAGHKIGKNLVVTKSIKNNAVTGDKVKDGSLTSADLAAGTLPVVGNTKDVAFASRADLPATPNAQSFLAPFGAYDASTDRLTVTTPLALRIADLTVDSGFAEGVGQAVQVTLMAAPATQVGLNDTTLSCTVGAGTSGCTAPGSLILPAGTKFAFRILNGPGGSNAGNLSISYSLQVQ